MTTQPDDDGEFPVNLSFAGDTYRLVVFADAQHSLAAFYHFADKRMAYEAFKVMRHCTHMQRMQLVREGADGAVIVATHDADGVTTRTVMRNGPQA